MSDDKSKDRVSVRTILDREGLNRTDGDKGMSDMLNLDFTSSNPGYRHHIKTDISPVADLLLIVASGPQKLALFFSSHRL